MVNSLRAGVILAALAGPAIAAEPAIKWNSASPTAAAPQARIPFARQGGIHDWTVVDDKTLYV